MVFRGNEGGRRILGDRIVFRGNREGSGGFEESHGFQRQRRVEAEDFVGVMWFSGVLERGGRRILGDHMVFRGNGWGRGGILGESYGFQG